MFKEPTSFSHDDVFLLVRPLVFTLVASVARGLCE